MKEPVVHYTHEADLFRTKVFGIQDGLIGVGALVLGVAGYSQDPLIIIVTGLISTIAQAFSMGVGEFISTRVRQQIIENEIEKESYEIENYPEKEKEELKQFYMSKGFSETEAEIIASKLMKNRDVVLKEMLIHELKMLPEEFESPIKLGLIMSIYLILGGLIPITPFIFQIIIKYNFIISIISSVLIILIILSVLGLLLSKYTGLPKKRSILEQIITGSLALSGSFGGGLLLSQLFPITNLHI